MRRVGRKIDSPWGSLWLESDRNRLIAIYLKRPGAIVVEPDPFLDEAEKQFAAYFQGRLKRFSLPFHVAGTDFQRKVWLALGSIPFGKLLTYSDIAKTVRSPGAVRAIGNALGKNPLPILLPCHRVIASGNRIGGFMAGDKKGGSIKRRLLALEGFTVEGEIVQDSKLGRTFGGR